MPQRPFALFFACTALLLSPFAEAAVVEAQSFEQMAARSPVIVLGTVRAQQARWDEGRRRIHTFTELQVADVLKGDVPSTLLVRQPGGEVGGIGAFVAGAARFVPGEEVLLFLETPPDDPSVFIVRGLSAGKIALGPDAFGRPRARRDLRGIVLYDPERPRPVLSDREGFEDLGDRAAFIDRIRKAVRAASGGDE